MKKLVYIASPYSHGDVGINTRFQMEIFETILGDGIVLPFAPLWSHFQHIIFPRPYEDWTRYDLDLINRGTFDACVRLNSTYKKMRYDKCESKGADGEVLAFEKLNLPVFYNLSDLYGWVKGRH
jgi:hypothetical protein